MNDTLKTIANRRSVRAFTDEPITAEHKELILEAAFRAPTAGNQQLYTIIDVTDQAVKDALVPICDDQPFISSAPMVLIFLADCLKWYDAFKHADCDPRTPDVGDLMLAVSDTNIAAENAVIAAESLGIGSCYIGDVMENCEKLSALLNLPEYVFPAAMLVFGHPTEKAMNRELLPRIDKKYVVYENTYRRLSANELRDSLSWKAGVRSYEDWIKAFCDRKYNSEFSLEMSRSVREYLKQYDK